MQTSVPILLTIGIALAAKVRVWNFKRKLDSESSTYTTMVTRYKEKVGGQHMFAFTVLLFIIYANVTSTVMKFFKCTLVDGEWMLHADYRIPAMILHGEPIFQLRYCASLSIQLVFQRSSTSHYD